MSIGIWLGVGWINDEYSPDKYSPNDQNRQDLRYKFGFGVGSFHPFELESALQQACADCDTARQIWSEPLRLLERSKSQPVPHHTLVSSLQSNDWVMHFTACHTLVALGGEAVVPLCALLERSYQTTLRRTAVWLLKSIAEDTTLCLKKRTSHLLCSYCLMRCNPRSIRLSWRTFTYYGCRACGQSREFLSVKVVVVLDAGMPQPQIQQNDVLRVKWLLRRSLFDFDWVEIGQATDEDAERFAVQVQNDTDAWRHRRYKKMRCVVAPNCELSENTLRILRDQFRRVEYHT